jgi:hypothetical protein
MAAGLIGDGGKIEMTLKPEMPAEEQGVKAEVESEIRDVVHRDVSQLRRTQADGTEAVNNINSLVQRVAGSSLREIDHLIRELEALREYLHNEGERVQREIAGYAQLSQAAMNSTKIIAESVAHWKKHADTSRKH